MSDTRSDLHDPQPAPSMGDGRSVTDVLLASVEARRALGRRKYQTELSPGNGRDVLTDLIDELLDAAAYATQWQMEQETAEQSGKRPTVRKVKALEASNAILLDALGDIATNYDHDDYAHREGRLNSCRVCIAEKAIRRVTGRKP